MEQHHFTFGARASKTNYFLKRKNVKDKALEEQEDGNHPDLIPPQVAKQAANGKNPSA